MSFKSDSGFVSYGHLKLMRQAEAMQSELIWKDSVIERLRNTLMTAGMSYDLIAMIEANEIPEEGMAIPKLCECAA